MPTLPFLKYENDLHPCYRPLWPTKFLEDIHRPARAFAWSRQSFPGILRNQRSLLRDLYYSDTLDTSKYLRPQAHSHHPCIITLPLPKVAHP
jgi:hypothetical protein